jgi:threonine/homoserine/homoserine lactone efflux protein
MQTPYHLQEFLTLAVLHLLVLVSPGLNFAVLMHYTLTYGKRIGLWLTFGVALGTALYVTGALCATKFLLFVANSRPLFTLLKWVGAAWIAYVGLKTVLAKKSQRSVEADKGPVTGSEAVRVGLFSQLSNTKAMVFFVALFTQVIDFHTPLLVKAGYGVWMCSVTFLWFALVVWLLSLLRVKQRLPRFLFWVSKACGVILIILATLLVVY